MIGGAAYWAHHRGKKTILPGLWPGDVDWIDLMFERGFAGHRILESNAFGDLLPNLTKNGRSVYQRQIELLGTRSRMPSPNT